MRPSADLFTAKIRNRVGLLLPILTLLVLASLPASAEQSKGIIQIKLLDSNSESRAMPLEDIPVTSHFFARDEQATQDDSPSVFARAWYKDIYPNIDLVSYGDKYQLEYIFIASPGADPSLIRSFFEGPQAVGITHTGDVLLEMRDGEITHSRPVVFMQMGKSKRKIKGSYNKIKYRKIINRNVISMSPGKAFDEQVGNEQYLKFLNNAQAGGREDPRGANMFFDKEGNVWFNQNMQKGRYGMFSISHSRLVYDVNKPVGSRYDHYRTRDEIAPFAKRPVAGVSWVGAAKYCNWLTIQTGRGVARQYYTEGTTADDWTPVIATKWKTGFFQAFSENSVKGFRVQTPFPPHETFLIHILYSFYMEPRIVVAEKLPEEGIGLETEEEIPIKAVEGAEGLFLDVVVRERDSDEVTADALALKPLSLTVTSKSPESGVSVVVAPKDINGDAHGTTSFGRLYPPGRSVTLSVPLRVGDNNFRSWLRNGAFYSSSHTVHVTMLEDITMTAVYVPLRTLSVLSVNPAGGVGINVSPPDDSGRSSGSTAFARRYEHGTGVTLSAPPFAGVNKFFRWLRNGAPYSSMSQVSVTMDGDVTMTAEYVPPRTLTAESLGASAGVTVTVSPSDRNGDFGGNTTFIRSYDNGTSMQLIAPLTEPAIGNIFGQWLRNGTFYSSNTTVNVIMDSDVTMTAVYISDRFLKVRSSAPAAGVWITIVPADVNGNASGATAFDRLYDFLTPVTLTAPATAGGNTFQKWQRNDGVVYTNVTAILTMNVNYTMRAVYVYVPGPIPDPDPSPSGI